MEMTRPLGKVDLSGGDRAQAHSKYHHKHADERGDLSKHKRCTQREVAARAGF